MIRLPRVHRGVRPGLGLTTSALVVASAGLVPVAYLVIRASGAEDIIGTLTSARLGGLLLRTVALSVVVTTTAVIVGTAAAWMTERTDLPAASAWVVLLALPLVVPSYVGAYTVLGAFGARGVLTSAVPAPTGLLGAWLVLSISTYPYVFLAVRAGLRSLDPSLEDAARGLGRTPGQVARSIVLPLLRPSIAAGGLLVALYTLHDFGAVSLLRYDTFTRAIFVRYAASFDRESAALLSVVLVVLALLVLGLEFRSRGRGAYHRAHAGGASPPMRRPLGRWAPLALASCALLVLAGLGLPILVVIAWLVRGLDAGVPLASAVGPAMTTAWLAAVAATVIVVASWPVAAIAARSRGTFAGLLERASYLGFGLPGIVVALSLVFFGARFAPAVYGSVALLLFGYAALFVSHAVGPLRASVLQVGPALEEAAASLGSSRPRTFARIVLPLVRPGVGTALALVLLAVMKELPATLLLAPPGYETLATRIWGATNTASFAAAALPTLALLAVACVPLGVVLTRRQVLR